MLVRILLLFLALVSFNTSLQANWWDNMVDYVKGKTHSSPPPTIRVLILHDVEGANLEVRGKYGLADPYTKTDHYPYRFKGKNRYIQALGSGLKWGEEFPDQHQLQINPDKDAIVLIDGQEYEGSIYIYDIGGTISIVDQVPLEDYVETLLVNYQNRQLEPETLAGLAIVARTNAYFQALNPKNALWTVDAQKVGFKGRIPVSEDIEEALKSTRHMVMSRTGVYEGAATPFIAQFDTLSPGHAYKKVETSKISLEEANQMAQNGEHAAQILAKAFPGSTIMLMHNVSTEKGQ